MNNTIEVGENILSYCGKCKADSLHIIFAMENSKISKVTCESCGAKHNYRKPKSLTEDKPSKNTKSAASRKIKKSSKKRNDILENHDTNTVLNYSIKQNYNESSIIRHSSFGIGVVTKKIGQEKIEVEFENGVVKLLVINWTA